MHVEYLQDILTEYGTPDAAALARTSRSVTVPRTGVPPDFLKRSALASDLTSPAGQAKSDAFRKTEGKSKGLLGKWPFP